MNRLAALAASLLLALPAAAAERKVGVLFVVHGGSDEQDVANTFDSTLQFFQYDPNNVIFKGIIWNPQMWPKVVSGGDSQAYANAATQLKKYSFSYARIGGKDPAPRLTDGQLADMTRELRKLGRKRGIEFVTDLAQWIGTQDQTDRLPWPRWMYNPQVPNGTKLTYCGSEADGGPWKGCNPQRYNVDGPGERLLKQGATEIVMVDMTVGGVRFWKTYDVVAMTRKMVADWNRRNGTDVQVHWVNDATDLMAESYPNDPPNWTRSLGPPKADSRVPLAGRGNPVITDPLLVAMNADGIEKAFNRKVPLRDTAVMFINHATRDGNETYDPKMDDTLVLDALVKQELLRRHPELRPENIVGSWMGIKEPNPNIQGGRSNKERTRAMRGEDLGSAWLYESDKQLPGGDHRYRYWDALELLKDQGAQHIVVIFSQIVIDSVLNMVEVPNQIAKEIGRETWLHAKKGDYRNYPEAGNPFAPYWGVWADTQCRIGGATEKVPDLFPGEQPGNASPAEGNKSGTFSACCFKMGGCGDARPYPPPRQAPLTVALEDTDPSLVFDIPAYGHLGYDPAKGPPSETGPVQDQYRGTWAMWQPLNDDPRMGKLLARQVVAFLEKGD
jgi:hypothetical protein